MDIGSQIGEEDENSELENIGAVGGARPKGGIKRTEKGKSYIAYIRWTDCHIHFKGKSRVKWIESFP